MALREIIKRVLHNEPLSPEELQELAAWLLSEKGREDFQKALKDDEKDLRVDERLDYEVLLKRVHSRMDRGQGRVRKQIRRYLWLAVSSAAVIAIGIFGWMRFIDSGTGIEIQSGTHRAILTLADGSDVVLDKKQADEIRQGGTVINIRDNRIDYSGDSVVAANDYHRLTVQRGGEFTLTLGDGTVVWMNSDSKLKYPMQFSGNERRVILEGEAYFQVSADPLKPFIVETSCQEIKVLGTKFNVSAYADETTVTTLVEGSVNLTYLTTLEQHRLVPGEQVTVDPLTHEFTVAQVDTGDVIAWTQGMFVFNDHTLEQVMRKLERWYDISVTYSDPGAKEIVFKGNLPRYSDLETLLSMIEKISSVRFETDRNHVNVTLK